MLQKLKDALASMDEAACRMPQDLPWQHLENARVAVGSVVADLESAGVATMVTVKPGDPAADPSGPVL